VSLGHDVEKTRGGAGWALCCARLSTSPYDLIGEKGVALKEINVPKLLIYGTGDLLHLPRVFISDGAALNPSGVFHDAA
jgi:hypothetical protein